MLMSRIDPWAEIIFDNYCSIGNACLGRSIDLYLKIQDSLVLKVGLPFNADDLSVCNHGTFRST